MTSILARIQANGGDVIRQEWRFTLRRGRLTTDAIAWVRTRWVEVCREVWSEFDLWSERAAIMEFDGGMARADAERAAFAEVTGC